MEKIKRLRKIAYSYYSRKDVQAALAEQAENKEVVPQYFDIFGKRPDMVEYAQDIANLATKGATSFHCSEEIWSNPLEISTDLKPEQLNDLRIGWDLLLDIDCKFIEYSKIAAWLICEALYFHRIRNFGLKFSGGNGFHIGLKFKAFPSKINEIKIKDFFPQGPRLIAAYLKDMISSDLAKRILEISSLKEISNATGKPIESLLNSEKKFDAFSILEIDTILISPRHLYRMAYSLHEKTGLASIVLKSEQLKAFHPAWANPNRVFVKPFMPEPKTGEAKELLIQALDLQAKKETQKERQKKERALKRGIKDGGFEKIKISVEDRKNLEQFYPKPIKIMLQGIKQDGRKRALFVLINFFKSLDFTNEEIEKIIKEWNKKNYRLLKDSYITTQLGWFKRQRKMLPPNFENAHYYIEIGAPVDEFSLKFKNPINYVKKRIRILQSQKKKYKKKGKKRSRWKK